jgi:hypothetical protein
MKDAKDSKTRDKKTQAQVEKLFCIMLKQFRHLVKKAYKADATAERRQKAFAASHELAVLMFRLKGGNNQWPVKRAYDEIRGVLEKEQKKQAKAADSDDDDAGQETELLNLTKSLFEWSRSNKKTSMREALVLATYCVVYSDTLKWSAPALSKSAEEIIQAAVRDWYDKAPTDLSKASKILPKDPLPLPEQKRKLHFPVADPATPAMLALAKQWQAAFKTRAAKYKFDHHNLLQLFWDNTWGSAFHEVGFPTTCFRSIECKDADMHLLQEQKATPKRSPVAGKKKRSRKSTTSTESKRKPRRETEQGRALSVLLKTTDEKKKMTEFNSLVGQLSGKHSVQELEATRTYLDEQPILWPVAQWAKVKQVLLVVPDATTPTISAEQEGKRAGDKRRITADGGGVGGPPPKRQRTTAVPDSKETKIESVPPQQVLHLTGPFNTSTAEWTDSNTRLHLVLFMTRAQALARALEVIDSCAGWKPNYRLQVLPSPAVLKPPKIWLEMTLPPIAMSRSWDVSLSLDRSLAGSEADIHAAAKKSPVPQPTSMGLLRLADLTAEEWKTVHKALVVDVVLALLARACAAGDGPLGCSGLGNMWWSVGGGTVTGSKAEQLAALAKKDGHVLFFTDVELPRQPITTTSNNEPVGQLKSLFTTLPDEQVLDVFAAALAENKKMFNYKNGLLQGVVNSDSSVERLKKFVL